MCERSYSEGGGEVDKLPAHIRDALKSAEEGRSGTDSSVVDVKPMDLDSRVRPPELVGGEAAKAEVERLRERCSQLEKREAALEEQVRDRDRLIRELREYVHDVLRLHERDHAYLRATNLDPAIGLEIELLKEQIKRQKAPDAPQTRELFFEDVSSEACL